MPLFWINNQSGRSRIGPLIGRQNKYSTYNLVGITRGKELADDRVTGVEESVGVVDDMALEVD